MENSDLTIKSEKQKNVQCLILKGDITSLTIDGSESDSTDYIDNPEYIWEICKVLHHAYNLGAFKKYDKGEIYEGNLTPTIFI